MIKIDLHTHSIISSDGGIGESGYERLLQDKFLDCIAITDHNRIDFAEKMHKKLGDKIIIGEEITTTEGEMIGLFLKEVVPSGLSAIETANVIKKQGGLVSIPHPFETLRQGIQLPVLEQIIEKIDIVEVFNGRGKWRGKSDDAFIFAKKYHLAQAASSDAHGYHGAGKTYTQIHSLPSVSTLKKRLLNGSLVKEYAPLWTFLYPSWNRMKNTF
ncbi:MAG TPA: PHP domain-containing protein [Patescibacteria group bacterium]|nr:PHP domain-containing protein [Patescibacteria group bacterium]